MRPSALLTLLLLAAPASAQREFGFDNKKASGQPYLTPAETVARMKVAPEFEVKLFAGEPQLANPIAFTIDERGRVWCVECFEYPSRTPKGKMPRDRIVILEDTDGDGACDQRTVFAEGKDFPVTDERKAKGLGAFDMASGIEVGHGGVYVGAPPYLWFIENKNDKPGKFETVLKGFGSEDTHETLNTFQWGPDGWLYGLHGVFTHSTVKPLDGPETRMNAAVWRFHPRTKKFEIFAEGTSNPWGMDYRNTDGQFVLACCVIPHLFHMVPGGVYKRQAGASFNPHAYGQINEICDHTFHRESGWAHAGLISLDVPHVPEKYRNSVIFGSIHGCSLKQNVLKPKGSSFTASKGEDFLVSGDKNVRPINLRWGPNGDIYMIDWHDQNPCHQAKAEDWDYERGRVYRIQVKGREGKKAEDLGAKTDAELAQIAVKDQDPYRYRQALRLISDRYPVKAKKFPDVAKAAFAATSPDTNQLRSAWLIQSVDGFGGANYARLSDAERPGVVRFHGPVRGVEWMEKLAATEPSAAVRRELASAAVRLADTHDVRPLLHALMARAEDANDPQIPVLLWHAYEKVIAKKTGAHNPAEAELKWLAEQSPNNILVRDQIVPRAMRRLVATGQPRDLELCLEFVASADAHTRQKALDGLTTELKGRSVPPPANWPATRDALAGDAASKDALNKLAVSFRDPEAVKRALAALKVSSDEAKVVEAMRQLADLRAAEAAPDLRKWATGTGPLAARVEAVRALAVFPDPKTPAELLGAWKTLPPAVRAEAVTLLSSRKEWAKALLGALKAGPVERADVGDSAVTRIEAFRDKELTELVATAWGRSRPTPADLLKQIDAKRADLDAHPGSFARGRAVFENQCGKCHQFDGKGQQVGPALDGAGRDIDYILANVIDPNRVIGAPYFQRIVTTLDGRVEQGLLVSEDSDAITLKQEGGAVKRFSKADLDGPVKVVEKSVMPEGLVTNMPAQDFRDLTRYLMAHPFVSAATVNGAPVTAGVGGLIPLPAAGEAVIEAKVVASADVKTQLLVGAPGKFAAFVDGKPVGEGSGPDRGVAPDRWSAPVALGKGEHTLRLVVKGGTAARGAYLRLLDPERGLTVP